SPYDTVLPRAALPFTLPRWLFRYFTRLGIRGIAALLGASILPVIDPYFYANVTLGGLGFGESVVDPGSQGRKRDTAEHAVLLSSHFGSPHPSRHLHPNPFGAILHRRIHGPVHGSPKTGAFLELLGNVFGDELGIDLGLVDLHRLYFDMPVDQVFEI